MWQPHIAAATASVQPENVAEISGNAVTALPGSLQEFPNSLACGVEIHTRTDWLQHGSQRVSETLRTKCLRLRTLGFDHSNPTVDLLRTGKIL